MSNTGMISGVETLSDGMLVQVSGDIDYSRSPELRVELLKLLHQSPRRVIVDLTAVPYMDSSGVATLVEALQVQRKQSGKLVLCGLQPKVKGIFEIARLNMVFTITADAQTARTA